MTHKHEDGIPIGQHPLVIRLKGVYNERPPQPCYSATWDVDMDVVTKHIAAIGPNVLSLSPLRSYAKS